MTPLKNKILVSVNMNQKSDYEIEVGGLILWVDSNWGADNRISKPTVARVESVGAGVNGLKSGDLVLCHHNAFAGGAVSGALPGDTGEKDGKGNRLVVINAGMVYVKLDKDLKAFPMDGYLTAERVKKEEYSGLIITPEIAVKNDTHRFKVLEVGIGCEPVKKNDTVICFKHADYEINYNLNKKLYSVIRIRIDDVLAIEK